MYEIKNIKGVDIMQIKRGQIWWADIKVGNGSIQRSKRPIIIVSNNLCNAYSSVITYVCLTSKQSKAKLPTHVRIERHCGVSVPSIALCEQPTSLCKDDLSTYIGICDKKTMDNISNALMIQLGIGDKIYA